MVEFEFLDEALDINKTKSYHLSIQISLNGFSFSILDISRNKYVSLKNYHNTSSENDNTSINWIKEILQEDEFLSRDYKSTAAIYAHCGSTLIPDPLFKRDNLKDYFSFNLNQEESGSILYNKIRRIDAWCVYSVPSDLINLLEDQFPGIHIFHHSVPFIHTILQEKNTNENANNVYINLHGSFFDIAVTNKGALRHYNCFPYKHVNDLLYFILHVFEQMKLPPEITKVILSGKVTRQSSFYENLRRYVKKLEFIRRNPHFKYSYTFEKLPEQSFNNLLNLYHCVL
jgi:hypothetical protein